ncbi:MauE/DoxX family redox-associated membrane protein [Maridesulfovibrio ferrireducens]|uniref:MauE/DoxX family redox-associated membrane protein n=1 Tax=Maridesulfovibrio ferrireducens TaxID=246191 RepID=UPI001A35D21C|nr:MauE/DoxX family redox-associated membrane protein [Maridesulfovibrio ferrireducens]MBI9110076.1 DoxX family membrane protein [Maridesulfovibrio ferrireducens]
MSIKSLPRIALGLVFIVACVGKIADPVAFGEIVKNYQILPDILVMPVAYFLPWLEFVCGALLVCGVMTETATALITAMLVLFIAVLSANLYRGIDVACGCFSTDVSFKSDMVMTIVRDVVLLVFAFLSFRFRKD